MAAYTTDAKVLLYLPAPTPATLTAAYRAQAITDACAEVDGLVGIRFGLDYGSGAQRFPDTTDSPATPVLITRCATLLAAAECWQKMYEVNREAFGKEDMSTRLREQVTNTHDTGLADKIRLGLITITISGDDVAWDDGLDFGNRDTVAPVSLGRYDSNGNLLDETPGTLDRYLYTDQNVSR